MMDKIKVLQFSKVINKDDFIDNIIMFADKERFEMIACTFSPHTNIAAPGYDKIGVKQYFTHTSMTLFSFIKTIIRLKNVIDTEKPQIVHPHHFYESLLAVFAAILSRTKPRIVIGRHYDEEFYITASGYKRKFYLLLESISNKMADSIIVPSSKIRDLLVKQNVKQEKVAVVQYGFNFSSEKYNLLHSTGRNLFFDNSVYVIGNFARHHPIKGQVYLLKGFAEAAKSFSEIRLLMVGEGKYHQELKAMAEELGISDKVLFPGWRKDVPVLLESVDMVIHPSLQEAFPQIMVESMSKERFMVITPVSGAADIIENEKNGFIIPFKDDEAVARAIIFARKNPDKAVSIGQQARQDVLNNLDIKRKIKEYEKVYEDVLCS